MKIYEGVELQRRLFLTSTVGKSECSAPRSRCFIQDGRFSAAHRIESLMCPLI